MREIVFGASYLVLGLGDVYLGAPVATPVDPRHRLVTTKYNPARTWTPENAVGIGGAYLCIYGMEGPGGYQFVGRTVPVWNRFKETRDFPPGRPWLLRFFDQIRFYPMGAAELLRYRADFLQGKVELDVREETFRLRDYHAFLAAQRDSIAAFKARQQAAFEAERERWAALPEFVEESAARLADDDALAVPPGSEARRGPRPRERVAGRRGGGGARRGGRRPRDARVDEDGDRDQGAGRRRGARDDVRRGPSGRGRRSDLRAATDGGGRACLTPPRAQRARSRWTSGRCGVPTRPERCVRPTSPPRSRRGSPRAATITCGSTAFPTEEIGAYVRALDGKDPATLPLYGVPFAIKDNIDLADAPTTVACPAVAYTAPRSAPAVARAIAAGAIPIGKTNLDQFATGLVGVRSPYGVPANPFDAAYVPGGSSSGSAVAVAAGLVSFALGTDTAGSGRVPAAFTNVVGLKPTRGRVSTTGVVPACRTLDCVSIFALTCGDAAHVLAAIEGFDAADVFSRPLPRARACGGRLPVSGSECRGPRTSRGSTPRARSSSRSRRPASSSSGASR